MVPVSNNNTVLLPQDVISQTCAQPPLSQAWEERGGRQLGESGSQVSKKEEKEGTPSPESLSKRKGNNRNSS